MLHAERRRVKVGVVLGLVYCLDQFTANIVEQPKVGHAGAIGNKSTGSSIPSAVANVKRHALEGYCPTPFWFFVTFFIH